MKRPVVIKIFILLGLASLVPFFQNFTDPNVCSAHDLASLKECVSKRSTVKTIAIKNNITCSGDECCPGEALINLSGTNGLIFEGNNFRLNRLSGETKCNALISRNSIELTIKNFSIVDNINNPSCLVTDKDCRHTVRVVENRNVTFENVHIYHSRGFGLAASGTNGLSFLNSSIINASIQGLYIGSPESMSNKIVVRNSIFDRVGTNAITFQGVFGETVQDNIIENNLFTQNHDRGAYATCGTLKVCNGGQIYFPNAKGVTVRNNTIANSYCENCNNTEVWAFELRNLKLAKFERNVLTNGHGRAFFKDPQFKIGADVQVTENKLLNWTGLEIENHPKYDYDLDDAIISNNSIQYRIDVSANGLQSNRIYRLNKYIHLEASQQLPDSILEDVFELSPYPNFGPAFKTAVLRCLVNGTASLDFISLDPNCEGQTFLEVLGFSVDPTSAEAFPFYRCRIGQDHFISWDSKCEGQVVEGLLGYAKRIAIGK